MAEVLIVGGGAAGMMSAVFAARRGLSVTVLEPNGKTGKKLRITGKGRCNVTNACSEQDFFKAVRSNAKFLRSAVYGFSTADAMNFFESIGVNLKIERGNRVFPVSDSANEVAEALEREALRAGAVIRKERALELLRENGAVTGVRTDRRLIPCDAVIICTGGISYPATGSTGDGYKLARSLGHTIVPPRASLVPLEADDFCGDMQGLSLRNVTLSLTRNGKLLYNELGEMLFTHFGVSGPLVLSASAYMRGEASEYRIELDLKPALEDGKLDERVLRDFGENLNRDLCNALDALLPQKMIPVVIARSGIDPHTKVNSITREQRAALVHLLKHFTIHPTARRSVDEAIVTAGGVDVREVDPRTMESKLCAGVYFAGEVLDCDACTGGFNLQIAWSTAYMAASSIPMEERYV